MARRPKALVEKTRTVHMYAELWHASRCVLEAGQREARGQSWQFLSSLILTFFSFEAYLNHVGDSAFACWESLGRLPPLAKFDLLCETLKVHFPKGKSARPVQTITALNDFRNTMAHGKTKDVGAQPRQRDINERLDAQLGDRPLQDWERRIQSEGFAVRAREDVEAVLKELHAARPEPKEGLFAFGLHSASATAQIAAGGKS
jgi:hypothetical protein